MSSVTRLNIDAIPKLSHDPSSYAPWRAAVEIALQLSDCWNAALGLDVEPGQAVTAERRVRAGSVMPTGSEAGELSWDDKRDWERWQARESRAQAILKGTASQAVRLDIEDLLAAVDMWRYCDRMHEADLLREPADRASSALDARSQRRRHRGRHERTRELPLWAGCGGEQ